MTLHGVTPTRVLRLCDALMAGKSPRDMRGLSRSGNAISGDICLKIHDHISKYPVKQTHYGGNLKNYLDARLNIKLMHEMFLNENPDCVNKVKYNFYNKYFQENFDYSFGRPRVDVCSKCQSFLVKMKDQTLCDCAKRRIAAEQMVHIWHANKFYAALQEAYDNKEDDTVAIAFDFMQNQPLPLIPVQEMFYLNQLWLNVFCIHDIKAKKANLYLYHEGIANKSADEVCTFLLHYIQTLPPTVTKLLLFSNGAEGHLKNHTVIRFLLSLCDGGGFETIRLFFPFCGHSFLPCEHDFGCLKRQLSKIDCIYTPEQYGELFVNASTTGQFTVHHVTTDDILAFKAWWPENYKRMTFCDVPMGQKISKALKEKFTISSYKEFKYSKQEKGKVVCKEFIASSQKRTFSLGKTRKAPVLPSAKAYPEGRVPINEKKIQDLIKLQDYSVGYETFYNEFFNWPSVNVNAAHMSALYSDFGDDS